MSSRKPPLAKPPIYPDRVRSIGRGFAFVPNRFLHDGFFASLDPLERSLYFFLVLAGDRSGVSYYSYERICSIVEMTPEQYIAVRNALIEKELIAFDGTRFQVLSLPDKPVRDCRGPLVTQDDFERDDPATVRGLVRSSFGRR